MALLDSAKIDKLFKALMNRARTSASKQYYEENIPTVPDVHASEIYLNQIPSTPPTANTSVVKIYTGLVLTKDTSVSSNLAWVALPSWQTGWSSGSDDVSQVMRNFISPKYGKGYIVKVYKGDGTRISELDNSNWMFDYKAGVLTFETDPSQDGSTVGTSIKIDVYQYIGQTVAAASTSTSISALTDVDLSTPATNGSMLMYDSSTSKWKPITLTSKPSFFDIKTISADGMRNVTVANAYSMGTHSLMVFLNGSLVLSGAGNDYIETDQNSITFNYDLKAGDQIVLRVDTAGYSI